MYNNLTGWQKVQMSRHPERPQTLDYIAMMCEDFIELHGDRTVKDDKAIVGGFATIDGKPVMIIGHQKGKIQRSVNSETSAWQIRKVIVRHCV